MQRLASIDIGSQTIRLLVADVSPEGFLLPVLKRHAIIRLGENMLETGTIKQEAIARAVACIADFIQQAHRLEPSGMYAVATACVRAARNSAAFLNEVFKQTGIMPAVLTGQEEASIALAGVLSGMTSMPESVIVIDIGGGSTELICTHNEKIIQTESIPLGVIALTERHLGHDPPAPADIRELRHSIQGALRLHGLPESAGINHAQVLGTAGTFTTLAAMDLRMEAYNCALINGHLLSRQSVQQLFKTLLQKNKTERSSLPGLEPGRSTVILAGTAIVLEIMKSLRTKIIQVSDAGLLEGVLIQKTRYQAL